MNNVNNNEIFSCLFCFCSSFNYYYYYYDHYYLLDCSLCSPKSVYLIESQFPFISNELKSGFSKEKPITEAIMYEMKRVQRPVAGVGAVETEKHIFPLESNKTFWQNSTSERNEMKWKFYIMLIICFYFHWGCSRSHKLTKCRVWMHTEKKNNQRSYENNS